jgi:hypothetical protein
MADLPGYTQSQRQAPVYVNGMPIDAVNTALANQNGKVNNNRAKDEQRFWSTPPRPQADARREVIEIGLNAARLINRIEFDLARFPHQAYLYYLDIDGLTWHPVVQSDGLLASTSITDSVPHQIVPANSGSLRHPQHYSAGHWVKNEFSIQPITTTRLRVSLQRSDGLGPIDVSGTRVPYSLGMRNFALSFSVRSRSDIPESPQTSRTEYAPFTSSRDVLGSPVQYLVRENSANSLATGGIWKCEPQPVPYAVVNLYVNARDSLGQNQTVDRFYIDPLTSGPHLNLYYAEQDVTGDFAASDRAVNFPLIRSSGSVTTKGDSIVFPNGYGYLEIDNGITQVDTTRPLWLAMAFAPGFDSNSSQPQTLLDSGHLSLAWTGTFWLATLGTSSMVLSTTFGINDRISMAIWSDENTGKAYFQMGDRVASTDYSAPTAWPSLRIGNTQGTNAVAQGNFLLKSLILKQQDDTSTLSLRDFATDASEYTTEARSTFGESSRNALLRIDPYWRSTSTTAPNVFGVVGGPGSQQELLVWTPVSRDFTMQKGYLQFNPVKAAWFKFEFTGLTAQPYDSYTSVVRRVKLYPSSILQGQPPGKSINETNTAGGSTVALGVASVGATRQFTDQVRVASQNLVNKYVNSAYAPGQALAAKDPNVAARLRKSSTYYSFVDISRRYRQVRFTRPQVHTYDTVEVEHTQRISYIVGIKSLGMFRVDYTSSDNTDQYIEQFHDNEYLTTDGAGALPPGWVLADGLLSTDSNVDNITTVSSVVFPSGRRLRGVQFATQQTPPVQLLPDPDFNNVSLVNWAATGDATLTPDKVYATDIGSLAKVTRGLDLNFWGTVELKYKTWDGIENSDPSPRAPTWDDLQGSITYAPTGGVRSAATVRPLTTSRLYAAARVVAPQALTAPLFVEIIADDGTVLSSAPIDVPAGQIAEWFTTYTVGEGGVAAGLNWSAVSNGTNTWASLQAQGTWNAVASVTNLFLPNVYVQVVQRVPTADVWYVDNISLFDDPLLWEFSNDSGQTWYPAYDIRNNPSGVLLFPDDHYAEPVNPVGFGLQWRVTSQRPNQSIASLVIRPWYTSQPLGVPYMETIQTSGPNRALIDHYPPIDADPRFKVWHEPVPQEWTFAFRQWLSAQPVPDVVQPTTILPDVIASGYDVSAPTVLVIPESIIIRRA